MARPVLVWFRRDFRLHDNPALHAAASTGAAIIPIYIDELDDPHPPGGAGRWWLRCTIKAFKIKLWLRRGNAAEILSDLAKKHDVGQVFWNRRYDPFGIRTDKAIKSALKDCNVDVHGFNGKLVREPFEIRTQSGSPYKVFTPYSRAWLSAGSISVPLGEPDTVNCVEDPDPLPLDEFAPLVEWTHRFAERFEPGEAAAREKLQGFVSERAKAYKNDRDRPDRDGTSELSPHLAWGEITPRQIIHGAGSIHGGIDPVLPFIRQVIWRDFAYHNLFQFDYLADRSLRSEFEYYPWKTDAKSLRRWQQGRTGFPIVDAGMRELWATGYMHNRVRMIVGSFLTKDLRIHWKAGADWFWDTLLDADLANNSMGWQWVAGTGIDAAPYFRIFNPTTQSEKFDPKGTYIRKWVPELDGLSAKEIHEPAKSGSAPPNGYPAPLVDHKLARQQALEGYQFMRG